MDDPFQDAAEAHIAEKREAWSETAPSAGAQAALENARLAIQLEEQHRRFNQIDPETRMWKRAWVCLMLARTPETWFALMNGEAVHENDLDQEWLEHFRKEGVWPT